MKTKFISMALFAILSTMSVSFPFSRMFRHYVGGVVLDLQSSTGYYKDLQSSYIHNLS